MADEVNTNAPVDAPAVSPVVASRETMWSMLRTPQPAVHNDSTEPTTTNGETTDQEEKEKGDETMAEHTELDDTTVVDTDAREAGSAPAEPASEDAPASGSKDKKRKSTGGVPEHKNKKNKKKNQLELHLDCKPGEYYWARLKGYPPWPSIICAEDMLPETLLATRPVSTARPDGSIRDDFKEGGKNAKERTFPIMFLSTNEFQWMVNTNLKPLNPKDCEELPKTKMTRALSDAYKIAAENHGIDHYRKMLVVWQEEIDAINRQAEEQQAEAERIAAEKAARAEAEATEDAKDKPKKKAPRKSKGADTDVEMDDADAPKSSKKRKKDAESDAEAKPKKTPKITKLNGPKTPNGDTPAAKKSASKPKKKVVTAPKPEDEDGPKPQLTEAEKLEQRQKAVLYLRHRLQKGFLARDQAPQEAEMHGMSEFFTQLEAYEDLEPSIIRHTKIHKVLKAIVKLATVPKDEQYNFKKRSTALLDIWNKRMEAEGDAAPASTVEKADINGEKTPAEPTPAVEGAKELETKAEKDADEVDEKASAAPDAKAVIAEAAAAEEKTSTEPAAEKDAEGDVSMQPAPQTAAA
ncbi:Hypothetical predicted protein [Lecanosticta acicola]|uniref:PWWP domain-containing protein n=1 Tax=Lecanosticta acicola TaxID=111012 RepID=A0AAI8Z5G2_9PEZI|nr:Hypothetical predicted protein [Lecanosticta acicola]